MRLSTDTLAALCDIPDVIPNGLIEVTAAALRIARKPSTRASSDGRPLTG